MFVSWGNDYTPSFPVTVNVWHFIGYTYSAGASNTITIYVDGQSKAGSLSAALNTVIGGTAPSIIGQYANHPAYYFQGSIADVQLYNTSLSASDVNSLYMEGIGGAPILSDGLVGWWPINGNANDYSSNNNNGQAANVVYTNSWTQGYTPP
jgi:hypothetical protein